MSLLSIRAEEIKPSLTLSVSDTARQMREKGENVISLSAGEPDFDTPEHIKEAAIEAIRKGETKYTAVGGTAAIKKAASDKFLRDNSLNYEPSELIISSGAKHVLFNAFMAILNPGHEVIIPAPYWVSYPEMIKLTGATPRIVPCNVQNNYLMTPKQLKKAISRRTRILILNSPSNPTGSVYTKEMYEGFLEILLKYPNIVIISDDIYEHILYTKTKFLNLLNLCPELRDRFIIVNGVSKAYAMTGWRIGIGAGPKSVIQAMHKIQGQTTSNASSVSQAAATAALLDDLSSTEEMRRVFSHRRDLCYEMLQEMPGVKLSISQGAFYAFPNISSLYETEVFKKLFKNSEQNFKSVTLCSYLLDNYKVAAVPGVAFGDDNCIRISYALSDKDLKEALKRIHEMITSLISS